MNFGNELKKAMVDCNIKGARELSVKSGLSYGKVIRALNGDGSSRYIDIAKLADTLGLKINLVKQIGFI